MSKSKLPPGAWDSHVHVIDQVSKQSRPGIRQNTQVSQTSQENFPFSPNRPFTPKKADVKDLTKFESGLGISHAVIVAASIYGTDNRSIVHALDAMGGKGRGVACIDPATVTEAELDELQRAGVVGVRLNLWSFGATPNKESLRAALQWYADRIRGRGWVLQVFGTMNQYPDILSLTPGLGVDVVIDHLGFPDPLNPTLDPAGREAILRALRDGRTWIKLSGTYRFPTTPGLEGYVKEVIETAPDRVVWASDWPHVGGPPKNPGGDRLVHQDFLTVDVPGFVDQCLAWCGGDDELIRKIWVDNPRRLWKYDETD
ncbi:tim barrel metal-dependent hydrolase [Colletotrichum musicola]|uniref:Tim barrel metal-dependent hydrolase n=1 Tax=Colletotrichum musicola TaxID=2175873 RepID=A0A8H6NDL5_9PEZI|nr:tim barrel metal-dependent hydrolase [Colletotrichum musicola]